MPRPTLNRRRRNITLPRHIDDDLAATAVAIGWTASDVLEHALARALPELRRMAELARQARAAAGLGIPPEGGEVRQNREEGGLS